MFPRTRLNENSNFLIKRVDRKQGRGKPASCAALGRSFGVTFHSPRPPRAQPLLHCLRVVERGCVRGGRGIKKVTPKILPRATQTRVFPLQSGVVYGEGEEIHQRGSKESGGAPSQKAHCNFLGSAPSGLTLFLLSTVLIKKLEFQGWPCFLDHAKMKIPTF